MQVDSDGRVLGALVGGGKSKGPTVRCKTTSIQYHCAFLESFSSSLGSSLGTVAQMSEFDSAELVRKAREQSTHWMSRFEATHLRHFQK